MLGRVDTDTESSFDRSFWCIYCTDHRPVVVAVVVVDAVAFFHRSLVNVVA